MAVVGRWLGGKVAAVGESVVRVRAVAVIVDFGGVSEAVAARGQVFGC